MILLIYIIFNNEINKTEICETDNISPENIINYEEKKVDVTAKYIDELFNRFL